MGRPMSSHERERRRRVCSRVRRACLVVACLSAAVFLVGHLIWFRVGWVDLNPRCAYGESAAWRELTGELNPYAAASFETTLQALYGKDAVRRVGEGRVLVRPVVVYFDDDGRINELTAWLTSKFATSIGSPIERSAQASHCNYVQHYLMAEGKSDSCQDRWRARLFNHIGQNSWPWMTSLFGVRQPSPRQIDSFPGNTVPSLPKTLPYVMEQPEPASLTCDATIGDKFLVFLLIVVPPVISLADYLWPF